jgi:hypothetical protein
LPETAGVDRGLNRACAFTKPRLENRRHFDPRGIRHPQQLVRAFSRNLNGLLDHHMLSRPHRRERRLEMRAARRGDAHDVDVRSGHEFIDARGRKRQLVLLRESPGVVRVARGDTDQPAAFRVRDRLGMKIGNHADADDAEAE